MMVLHRGRRNAWAMDQPEQRRLLIVTCNGSDWWAHCYTLVEFTHQGASYVPGLENLKNIKWKGTTIETGQLIMEFYRAAAWRDKNDRPLALNEFGAINNADMGSSARYQSFTAREMEKTDVHHLSCIAYTTQCMHLSPLFRSFTALSREQIRVLASPAACP